MENSFSECLDGSLHTYNILEDTFIKPLLSMFLPGTTKTQKKSASYCLRHLMLHLMENHNGLVTLDLAEKIVYRMINQKVTESDYSELIVDLVCFYQKDVAATINGNFDGVLNYSTKAVKLLSKPLKTDGVHLRL